MPGSVSGEGSRLRGMILNAPFLSVFRVALPAIAPVGLPLPGTKSRMLFGVEVGIDGFLEVTFFTMPTRSDMSAFLSGLFMAVEMILCPFITER